MSTMRLPFAGPFLRSLLVQGSWNYRSLIGAGFAFALLPALRRVYAGDDERLRDAVRRHSEIFNSHPYFAPLAIGAVARMEADGAAPVLIDRFKAAVRGSLGALGDRLVWATFRPVTLLFAIVLVLLGSPWWLVLPVFLLLYNAGHFALRVWCLRTGLRYGIRVAEQLRAPWLARLHERLATAGMFLSGAALPLLLLFLWPPETAVAAALAPMAGVVVGLKLGVTFRDPLVYAILTFIVVGVFAGVGR